MRPNYGLISPSRECIRGDSPQLQDPPWDPSHTVGPNGNFLFPIPPAGTGQFTCWGRGTGQGWVAAQEPRSELPPVPVSPPPHSILEGTLWKVIFLSVFGFLFFLIFTFVFLPSQFKRKNNSHPTICSSIILSSLQIFRAPKQFVSVLFPLCCFPCVSFLHF